MLIMKTQKNLNKGFTLVELIVVIAIIAVLSVVAVVAYSNISSQAEEAAIRSDANTVIRALNTYNALTSSGTPISNTTTIDSALLQSLKLDVGSGDSIDMQLGVTIDGDRLTAVMGVILYDDATTGGGSNMWILIPS